MKKLIILFGILSGLLSYAQVNWQTWDEAAALQNEQSKKILVFFYTQGCKSCAVMEREALNHPVISSLINKKYYAVKIDAEQKQPITAFGRTFINTGLQNGQRQSLHDFTKYMNISATPALVFMDEKMEPVTNLQGEFTAGEIEPYLQFIGTNEYKKVTSRKQWETYRKKFKTKLRD